MEASDIFRLNVYDSSAKETIVNLETSKSLVLNPKINCKVYGLSISGNIARTDNNYFIRIILTDTTGEEYLIFETYKELLDQKFILFENYCEETKTLDGIQPESIKIIVYGATVNIERINYLTEKKDNISKENLRAIQIDDIVSRINEYNLSHNKLWRAGKTSLSMKGYTEKKRILGIEDEEPTGGIEYYVGGIFEIGEKNDKQISWE